MTLIDGCLWHEGNADMLQMRFGVDLSLLMMIVNYSVFYLDPICIFGRRCPSPGDPRGLKEKAMRRLLGCRRRALKPDLIGPQVGTPPITIGAFERQGPCPQLVLESCASALHFKDW